MNIIVATDKNWGIGKDNKLLVHLPGDLKYFKETTMGKVLVMGRKTLESLPGGKPLPGRKTVVLSTNTAYEAPEGVVMAHSFDELLQVLLMLEVTEGYDPDADVFVAGGASIYKQLFPYCERFYVTRIDEEYEADSFFPNMDELVEGGLLKVESESETFRDGDTSYRFLVYTR